MRIYLMLTFGVVVLVGCGDETHGGLTRSQAEASARSDYSGAANPRCPPITSVKCRPRPDGWNCAIEFADGNSTVDLVRVITGPETGNLC